MGGALRPILWPVLIPSLLLGAGMGATVPVQVLAALSLGASQSFAAVIVGIMGAVSLACTVPAGALIDRLGDTKAMVAATGAAIVATGLTVTSLAWHTPASLALYCVSLFIYAPITDVWSLARQALVAETVPSAHMGKAMTALGGTQRAGNLVGPLISAGLLLFLPLWSVFVFSVLAAATAAFILFLPAARALDAQHEEYLATAAREAQQLASDQAQTPQTGLRALDVNWTAVTLSGVAVACLAVARAVQPIVIQLWGVQSGLHESTISLLIAMGATIELIVMFAGAYIKDRLGRVATLVICLSILGSGFILLILLPGFAGSLCAVAVMALGNGLGAGINMTMGADLGPAVGRPRFLGVWAIFTNAGKLGGPSLLSAIIALASLNAGIVFTGALGITGALWVAVLNRRLGLPGRRSRR